MTATSNNAGHIGWRKASWEEVLSEVNDDGRFPPDTTHVLLERTEDIKFKTKSQAAQEGLFGQHWPSGHVFNAVWELNWEKQGDIFLLHLLTEGEMPDRWQEYETYEVGKEVSLLLFGERKHADDPGWREARIPRWLEYPVQKTEGCVHIVVVPYCRSGMTVRMRLKGVKTE